MLVLLLAGMSEAVIFSDNVVIGKNLTVAGTAAIIGEFDQIGNMSNLTTTQTDLVTAINEVDSELAANTTRIATLETDLPANVTRIETLEALPYWHIQTIETPVVADVDRVLDDVAVNETGFDLTSDGLLAQPDVSRTITVTPGGPLTAWFKFVGTNIDDAAITEYVNFSSSSSAANTDSAFKSLVNVSGAKTGGDDQTADVGVSDEIGLDAIGRVVAADLDGTPESTMPTLTVGDTVEKYTADLAGTLTGAKDVTLYTVREAS